MAGLGSSVTKKCTLPEGTVITCPWCRCMVSDDTVHAITSCQHPDSKAIRDENLNKLFALMRKEEFSFRLWTSQFDHATSAEQQACLLLNAANHRGLTTELRRKTMYIVTDFLCQIRRAHPTYTKVFSQHSAARAELRPIMRMNTYIHTRYNKMDGHPPNTPPREITMSGMMHRSGTRGAVWQSLIPATTIYISIYTIYIRKYISFILQVAISQT